jgi:hypothetical protein
MSEDSRRRSLLDSVNAELKSIPKFKKDDTETLAGSSLAAGINAFTAARRGLRALKGADSSSALKKQKQRLETIIAKEAQIKSMAFELGKKGGPFDYNGNPIKDLKPGQSATTLSVSQALSRMYEGDKVKRVATSRMRKK